MKSVGIKSLRGLLRRGTSKNPDQEPRQQEAARQEKRLKGMQRDSSGWKSSSQQRGKTNSDGYEGGRYASFVLSTVVILPALVRRRKFCTGRRDYSVIQMEEIQPEKNQPLGQR